MIYAKNNPAPKNHRRYEQEFEYIFVLSKGKPAVWNPIMEKSKYGGQKRVSGSYRQGKDGLSDAHGLGKFYKEQKIKGNIWYYSVGWGHSYKEEYLKGHPAGFPERLAQDLILSWSNEGDLVYDPFTGAGTTEKMAILTGRRWIGSEISEEYCQLANRRIADAEKVDTYFDGICEILEALVGDVDNEWKVIEP
jgi:site-specific DNA-methyltransferase (adenine-specific)